MIKNLFKRNYFFKHIKNSEIIAEIVKKSKIASKKINPSI